MKTCNKCGETKPLDEYHRDKNKPDGRTLQCKQCRRAYHQANRDRFNAKSRAYRAANKDRLNAQDREYYEANRDRIKAYRARNADRIKAVTAEYRARNADRIKAYRAEYYEANPHVNWKHKYIRRCDQYGITPVVEAFTREDVIDRYGDGCFYCEDGAFEHLDHYIPIKNGGHHTLEGTRPSCAACNLTKHDKHPDEWLAEQAEIDALTEEELEAEIEAEIARWTD